jgi:hypothetical protein
MKEIMSKFQCFFDRKEVVEGNRSFRLGKKKSLPGRTRGDSHHKKNLFATLETT